MAQQVKVLAAKPDDLHRTHMVEGENLIPASVLKPPHRNLKKERKKKKNLRNYFEFLVSWPRIQS